MPQLLDSKCFASISISLCLLIWMIFSTTGVMYSFYLFIVPLVLGIFGIIRVNKLPQELKGKWMGVTGIVLSIIVFFLSISLFLGMMSDSQILSDWYLGTCEDRDGNCRESCESIVPTNINFKEINATCEDPSKICCVRKFV